SVIAASLEREPEPMSRLQPLTPPALERLVRRCLAKDPDDRWQTARDLLAELRWLSHDSNTSSVTVGASATPSPRRAWLLARSMTVVTVLAVVTLAVVAGSYLLTHRQPTPSAGLDALQVVQLTTSGNAERPAISPD